MKFFIGLAFVFSLNSFAEVTLQCKPVLGESVYSSFQIELPIDDRLGMPFDLSEAVGKTISLNGEANPNHPDVLEDQDNLTEEERWAYVTLGTRTAKILENLSFSMEPCLDCDFNGAKYEYKNTSEGEIFITEFYGSDGSGEFSVYSCEKVSK